MPKWSSRSLEILHTAHHGLQVLFNRVIRKRDCTVMQDGGARTPGRQVELMGAGRSKVSDPLKSKHVPKNVMGEYDPEGKSLALDVMPYPVDWRSDKELLEAFISFMWNQYDHKPTVEDLRKDEHFAEVLEVLENIKRHHNFTGYVMGVADTLNVEVRNGQDWNKNGKFNDDGDFIDTPHWEMMNVR